MMTFRKLLMSLLNFLSFFWVLRTNFCEKQLKSIFDRTQKKREEDRVCLSPKTSE